MKGEWILVCMLCDFREDEQDRVLAVQSNSDLDAQAPWLSLGDLAEKESEVLGIFSGDIKPQGE